MADIMARDWPSLPRRNHQTTRPDTAAPWRFSGSGRSVWACRVAVAGGRHGHVAGGSCISGTVNGVGNAPSPAVTAADHSLPIVYIGFAAVLFVAMAGHTLNVAGGIGGTAAGLVRAVPRKILPGRLGDRAEPEGLVASTGPSANGSSRRRDRRVAATRPRQRPRSSTPPRRRRSSTTSRSCGGRRRRSSIRRRLAARTWSSTGTVLTGWCSPPTTRPSAPRAPWRMARSSPTSRSQTS
jgi:hypothetical protein